MMPRVALVVFLLASPALFAAKPPKSLLGNWAGTQETIFWSSVGPNRTSTVSLRSTWKIRGASYVWTERVLSSTDGRLLGTRVIILTFDGIANIKATDGTHFTGLWTYDKNHKKLVIDGGVPDDNPDNGDDFRFENVLRMTSADAYRIRGSTYWADSPPNTSVSTVEKKQ